MGQAGLTAVQHKPPKIARGEPFLTARTPFSKSRT